MDESDLKNKQKLAIELNMKFDEACDLFSEETLNSMRMEKVLGGDDDWGINILSCSKGNCGNCNCGVKCDNIDVDINGIICVSLDLPTVPKPTLTKPSLAN